MKFKSFLQNEDKDKFVSMKRYIIYFFFSYLFILFGVATFFYIFTGNHMHGQSIITDFLALIAASEYICLLFKNKYHRLLYSQEYQSLLQGALWTTTLFQLSTGILFLSSKLDSKDLLPLLLLAIVATLIHALAVWLALRISIKNEFRKYATT